VCRRWAPPGRQLGMLGPLALCFVLRLLTGHSAKDTCRHPPARCSEVEGPSRHRDDRDSCHVDQVDEVFEFPLVAVEMVVVPADDPVYLPVFHRLQHGVIAWALSWENARGNPTSSARRRKTHFVWPKPTQILPYGLVKPYVSAWEPPRAQALPRPKGPNTQSPSRDSLFIRLGTCSCLPISLVIISTSGGAHLAVAPSQVLGYLPLR